MTGTDRAGTAQRLTLADVAVRAGVSRSTASLVLRDAPGPSEPTREAVRRAASALGFRPDPTAKLLRQHRSRLLGIVFDPGDPFHADLLEAVYPAAEKRGYDILLAARVPTRSEERAVEGLLASRCEGLVLIASTLRPATLRAIGARHPVAIVGRRGDKAGVDSVRTADQRGADAAVELLVSLGHRRVRHVDGGRRPGAADRRRGYRTAMQRHGLVPDITPGDHTEESGVRAAHDLIAARRHPRRERPPTAVLASNDRCAVGMLDTLLRAGVDVPGQISVVGYDDSRLAGLTHVNLTTLAQESAQIARLAVETVIGRLDDDALSAPAKDLLLNPRLVVRGTTGPAPS